jgi:hypothetical protein
VACRRPSSDFGGFANVDVGERTREVMIVAAGLRDPIRDTHLRSQLYFRHARHGGGGRSAHRILRGVEVPD